MKRGNSNWKPWRSRGVGGHFQQQKSKPAFVVPNNTASGNSSDEENAATRPISSAADVSFSTEREPGSFISWKLYFPDKGKIIFDKFLTFISSLDYF